MKLPLSGLCKKKNKRKQQISKNTNTNKNNTHVFALHNRDPALLRQFVTEQYQVSDTRGFDYATHGNFTPGNMNDT